MKLRMLVGAIGISLTVGALPSYAHHPFAVEFDSRKPLTLKGNVNKFEWTNPHAVLAIDVVGPTGEVTAWTVELGGPGALSRRGWKESTLKSGDKVTIDGWAAKDGSHRANAKSVTLEGGNVLNAASSYQGKAKARTE